MQRHVEKSPETSRVLLEDRGQARQRCGVEHTLADDVHRRIRPAAAGDEQVTVGQEGNAPGIVDALCDDAHAKTVLTVSVFPRPVAKRATPAATAATTATASALCCPAGCAATLSRRSTHARCRGLLRLPAQ